MATLDYSQPIGTHRYSRWGVVSICVSLGGLALMILALVTLRGVTGMVEYRAVSVLLYICCLLFGFISSAIGYFRDDRQRVFCCIAFMVSLVPVLAALGIPLAIALLGRR